MIPIFVEFREPDRRIEDSFMSFYKMMKGKRRFIALTPYTVDFFQRRSIDDFSVPEDYYLWQEDEGYGEWFRGWLERLEQVVVSHHPFFEDDDIPVTVHCMTMLKNVMDAYIRTALQYFKIMEKEGVEDSLIPTGDPPDSAVVDEIDDELYFKRPSLYYRLIRNVFQVQHSFGGFTRPVYQRVGDWVRCLQFLPSWKENKKVVFVSSIPDRIREAKLRGYQVKNLPIPKVDFSFSSLRKPPRPLFQSIDEEFDFPPFTSQKILWPRVRHFICEIVPHLREFVLWYEKHFLANDFSCLVFNRRNQLYQYGALIAARRVGLPCAYIRHGWDAYDDNKLWWRIEQRLRPFDYFICPNRLDVEFFRPIGKRAGCKVI